MSHRPSLDSGLRFLALAAAALVLPLSSTAAPPPSASKPPVAAIHARTIDSPGGSRVDDYYWLRDDQRKNPEMLGYLNAENAYTDAVMAHTKAEQDSLYEELTARIKPDDSTVPARKNGWWYTCGTFPGRTIPSTRAGKAAPTRRSR
jgi:oligopeptidase B